ncbi:DUF480 domain-containing protein, partial [Planctomycetota bacterium]|nr:DUF480 domain-containing protein [Planctomycetota bacterium]
MELLSAIERRVLGALIEKSLATPQNYPLSLNSLTNACNQKNAREPVTAFEEYEVTDCLRALKGRSLAMEFFGAGSRVSKWEEALSAVLELTPQQSAVLAELLLRGPQTESELRSRAPRMAEFENREAVTEALTSLTKRDEPLAKLLGQPGSRGVKWTHLLYPEGEEPTADTAGISHVPPPRSDLAKRVEA